MRAYSAIMQGTNARGQKTSTSTTSAIRPPASAQRDRAVRTPSVDVMVSGTPPGKVEPKRLVWDYR